MAESHRIGLAHLSDPLLAIHTSQVQPLPHQITAVYGELLPRQPLRFLLADDPGAGKTVMTGLFLKELLMRGDLRRCLIVCPGSLTEQWEDELATKFGLEFKRLERTDFQNSMRNPFDNGNEPFLICRLDQLSRVEDVQDALRSAPDWDVVVFDEAHKLSASFAGNKINETKRHQLGRLLGGRTRHLLLLTATPHNGREEDFSLFLRLLDPDRFEGKPHDDKGGVGDVSDLMRRMVKEQLVKFDNTPLFPERHAYTITYALSDDEKALYEMVTDYVRDEMDRAERLDGRTKNVVGFALTVLQRRLASSPAAIHSSLQRRRERLEKRLQEGTSLPLPDIPNDMDNLDDFYDEQSGTEVEDLENLVVDRASASQSRPELEKEIASLLVLEHLALEVKRSGYDRKWNELSALLQGESRARRGSDEKAAREMRDADGHLRKLIVFTEHRDTLEYLAGKIRGLIGRRESVVCIHGKLTRNERKAAQEAFTYQRDTSVLLATDAAGEGINLQCAHLMVNYDLPWNPNRIEQRFGRIHRIGQTEVCHLWNLVADETREGDVFITLLDKLDVQRVALNGSVFDVLGQSFSERSLREMLIEAVRYGEQPDVRAKLSQQIDQFLDLDRLRELLRGRALVEQLSESQVEEIRDMMDRAEAQRLQPHFIAAYFRAAWECIGGTLRPRETGRYEIPNVPAAVRNRAKTLGLRPALALDYRRITFEKERQSAPGQPVAAFVCPGHPLLEATRHVVMERCGNVLKQGTILVDERSPQEAPRVLFLLEHAVQDARRDKDGKARDVSRQLHYVEVPLSVSGQSSPLLPFNAGHAVYLDYRPLRDEEGVTARKLAATLGFDASLEKAVISYAVSNLAIPHEDQIKARVQDRVARVRLAVAHRLEAEIRYYDTRAHQLAIKERAGQSPGTLNSSQAKEKATALQRRLQERLAELDEEGDVQSGLPLVVGSALILPARLLSMSQVPDNSDLQAARERIDALAVAAVMKAERSLGHEPKEMAHNNPGYDIESRLHNGHLRFLEVKGKSPDNDTVTVSKTQILTSLNAPDSWVLALVEVNEEGAKTPVYVRHPFDREPDFGVVSVNYGLRDLLARGENPF